MAITNTRDGHAATPIRLEPEREERLRGLLVEFALGNPSGKYFFVEEMEVLREDVTQLLGEITALRSETPAITLEQARAVINAHAEAEYAAKRVEAEQLIGRFFKYRNSYGSDSVKWWLDRDRRRRVLEGGGSDPSGSGEAPHAGWRMTATTQDRELSHPAARIAHAAYAAALVAAGLCTPGDDGGSAAEDGEEINTLLEHVMDDLAALYQDSAAKDGQLADLREEGVRMAQYIVRLEDADTKHMLAIAELKTRLARAAAEIEDLYASTNHEVGHATERHLQVLRAKTLLDVDTPLPPRRAVTISTPTPYGAPRVAASH